MSREHFDTGSSEHEQRPLYNRAMGEGSPYLLRGSFLDTGVTQPSGGVQSHTDYRTGESYISHIEDLPRYHAEDAGPEEYGRTFNVHMRPAINKWEAYPHTIDPYHEDFLGRGKSPNVQGSLFVPGSHEMNADTVATLYAEEPSSTEVRSGKEAPNTALVDEVDVEPEHQGRGLEAHMLLHGFQFAKERGNVMRMRNQTRQGKISATSAPPKTMQTHVQGMLFR